ncbi:enhanced serine sensitivity protein SseB C-terminal domain-containing protein [Solimonas sp. K1W22B-7]|uniref:enhanced serine sensitivity protein SseB C-terminal domain-containing protein n=1 Tax=Solimonas sp. K1W22B-7 TaxID=2303331 RepID=UPI0013C42A36|nr:enhanced serine sensitivity protein SseB C-terminal domain-containing protein [Solimonas sp. K1W22B-7]
MRKDTQVLLGQPSRHPDALAAALERLFKTRTQVKRAWLAHFHNPETGDPPHTLIAVEATGDRDALIAEAGMVAQNVSIPDPPVDFVAITGHGGGVEDYFLKSAKPFYSRRFLGLF